MAVTTTYHLGGYKPTAPAKNKAEEYDGQAGTYTRWDTDGTQLTQRALTADESALLAAQDASITANNNESTLRQRAQTALSTNANFLAIASPTTAQAVTQVKALTKECNAIIRLLLNQLDDITGT